jgi:hypothetical protein
MIRDELVLNLSKMGIHESCYSLGRMRNSECVCVVAEGEKWKVYYVERDKPLELAAFDSVEDAYDFVYKTFCKWLGKDPK